jgi:F-type H+-transporting ATPase subunit delta
MPADTPSADGRPSRRIDVRLERVAAVYAQAVLGAAEKAGQVDTVAAELAALVRELLDRKPDLEAVLAADIVAPDDKLRLLDKGLAGRVHPLVLDFLKVLARHGRLGALRAIENEVQKQVDARRGRVRVQVASAAPLGGPQATALATALRASLRAEPVLESAVQPELIGGLVVRVGDTVYDGSVARQLVQVREQMIYRSVHEIQSRRDRFRLAGGN